MFDGGGDGSGQEFFDRYLQPSGRIARTDEGDDTVSEGQSYGMLMAAAIGDRENFQRIWTWTDQTSNAVTGCWRGGGQWRHRRSSPPPTPT